MKGIVNFPIEHNECPFMEGMYDDQYWQCELTGLTCEGYKDKCPALWRCTKCRFKNICIIKLTCGSWITDDFVCNRFEKEL